ncbi:hypothetical protein LSAT2_003674 [Lamellibrachia satsuma]|nr:hypothetical protein LSAT2_003674 [Lamellibrachia satsuma]
MALEIAKLINCGESDRDNIDSLLEEYLFENDDESDTDTDSDVCIGESSDENDDINERRNGYDNAMDMAAEDEEIVLDSAEEELAVVNRFRCSCKHNKGEPCYTIFQPQQMVDMRLKMADFTPREQMLIFLGKLSTFMNLSERIVGRRETSQKLREHQRTRYYVDGHQLCRHTFKFVHAISQNRLTSLIRSYKTNGLVAKEKRSGGRRFNIRAHSFVDIEHCVAFITNYVEDHALALPGRIPGCRREAVKLLPSSETKVKVYGAYKSASEQAGNRVMSLPVFGKTWRKLIPGVITAKPMSDLCWTCQSNNHLIYRGANLPEDEKSQRLKDQETCGTLKLVDFSRNVPCSRHMSMHYSFDFAQQVHLPSDPLQPGPLYFLVPRKCGIFGVCCEGLPKQVNFLTDEAHLISKGSNAVVSYLHYFFECFGLGETTADLHCDNCAGQNKNRFVLWYCAWRVANGLHQFITLNFLVMGHTKFAPDACFGLLKRAFKRHAISSLSELETLVNGSACLNSTQLVGRADGLSLVPVADWQAHLSPHFKALPGIKKYFHFRFDAASPGIVFVKTTSESPEEQFDLMVDSDDLLPPVAPVAMKPPELGYERQQYLYKNIRRFVKDCYKDVLCPSPPRGRIHPMPGHPLPLMLWLHPEEGYVADVIELASLRVHLLHCGREVAGGVVVVLGGAVVVPVNETMHRHSLV